MWVYDTLSKQFKCLSRSSFYSHITSPSRWSPLKPKTWGNVAIVSEHYVKNACFTKFLKVAVRYYALIYTLALCFTAPLALLKESLYLKLLYSMFIFCFIHIFNLDCCRLHERVLINLLSGFYNSDSGSWMFVWTSIITIYIYFLWWWCWWDDLLANVCDWYLRRGTDRLCLLFIFVVLFVCFLQITLWKQ